ncbi:MAG TPA: phosphotransferase family protein [Gammaproteobacteria bacterium]|jgi:aminoglycoside phosphotransferase (APT) family kinase protein|nr:phosphotransferase family protein [Gammaproteobacteria bacterium]
MHPSLKPLGDRIIAYLAERWSLPVALATLEQIPGGASRETYRVRVSVAGETRGLIVRRDPKTSLIDTERALEYQTYEAVHGAGYPVPEPLFLEEDPRFLERPFSVMAEIPGCETQVAGVRADATEDRRERLGANMWMLLGELAALDIDALGVTRFMPVPQHAAARELEYWARVIETDAQHPQPVAMATIRWLREHLPPPSKRLALVHGDYRTGNFLFTPDDCVIRGVLDWEMAHIGDPLEDLAWSLDPLWCWPERERAGGLVSREAAIRFWEQASGFTVDRAAFRWWQVFASLKALAIWISSTEDFLNGETKEPILAMAGWIMTDRQNRILVDRLHPASAHVYTEPLA